MTVRTTVATVTFLRPFTIVGIHEELPAGSYEVETDEERLEGFSFPAYRRMLTILHIPGRTGQPILTRSVTVDPKELEMAIERDRAATLPSADRDVGLSDLPRPAGLSGDTGTEAEMEKYGITWRPVDHFHYREFRYTSPGDAIAQAKRDQPAD